MTPSGQTVCLCMIVKDEAHVIARCLASARPVIDRWLVVDTGSTDGTQAIVREAMAGVPGEVVERPWVDFGHNRSEALALARSKADYSLIIDADDVFEMPAGFAMPELDADSYTIDIDYGVTTYRRPQLVSNALEWRYRGVLHEFIEGPGSSTSGHLQFRMRINHEGRRSTRSDTYAKDAAILAAALETETDPFLVSRYTFYLAQSYRDCGRHQESLDAYLRRAELGFWPEEIYVSLYEAGRRMEALGRPADEILAAYARAMEATTTRVEAAHAACRFCRHHNRFAEGHAIAAPYLDLPAPPDGLFVETWIYDYGLRDEFAVNAFWSGHYRDCLDATLRALETGKVPEGDRPRYFANMRFAMDRLPKTKEPPKMTLEATPEALAAPGTRAVPKVLHLGSGKDFRDDWLNVDVDATWSPDAVLDLSRNPVGSEGIMIETRRFGPLVLRQGMFDAVVANDVLEHVPDLVSLMTNCLALLEIGGRFEIGVPYDLALGAWQDPTHVRAFNERSWLYYTDWFWYLGWRDARFVVDKLEYSFAPSGIALRDTGTPLENILHIPRAIDSMSVTLRKIALTSDDLRMLGHWRDRRRQTALASGGAPVTAAPATALEGTWADNKDRYCIWTVTPPGSVHHRGFDDVAVALSAAFAELGGSAPVVASRDACAGRTAIVLGAHLLASSDAEGLDARAIVFNLEQVDDQSLWNDARYRALLKTHPVLDFSAKNTRALAAAGIPHVRHLAIRGMPIGRLRSGACDIDVLFYGSINARRANILDSLRAEGLVVETLFGVYGKERDQTIARAKVVVNIHYYAAAVFEQVRVSHLLACGACVVSEGEPDDPDVADLTDALVLCPYDEIVQTCIALVADPNAREALSRQAMAAIATRPQSDILRAAFT